MSSLRNLSADYIKAWCEEWEISDHDRLLLLQRYAQNEDDWDLIDFMCDLARERRQMLARALKETQTRPSELL